MEAVQLWLRDDAGLGVIAAGGQAPKGLVSEEIITRSGRFMDKIFLSAAGGEGLVSLKVLHVGL